MKRVFATVSVAISLVLMGAQTSVAQGNSTPQSPDVECHNTNLTVSLSGGDRKVSGTLCVPQGATDIQLLVHGFTYDREFWDFPYHPDTYSYVRHAHEHGFATFAIDRIGVGKSWQPSAHKITLNANIDALHQVIQSINNGDLGRSFDHLFVVSHSIGAIMTNAAIGKYGGVDAYVALGSANGMNIPKFTVNGLHRLHPATVDKQFRGTGIGPGYVTMRPGTRSFFYNQQPDDSQVLKTDNQHLRAVDSLGALVTGFTPPYFLRHDMRQIDVPVFAINGSEDAIFCGGGLVNCSSDSGFKNSMTKQYPHSPHLETLRVEGSGHNVTLEPNAPHVHKQINDFLDRMAHT